MEKPAGMLPNLQVFASDLDDTALHRAREGLYPEVIEADVSDERLSRFFIKEGEYYRVTRELRDLVLFSNHSVLRDPPFSHQDLISCRNLLIYLQRELQERVFQIFHYALNPERYLFLGNSESAEMVHDLFHTIDKSHRFFQARPWAKEYPTMPALPVHIRVPTHHRFSSGTADKDLITGQEKHFSITRYHANSLEKAAPPSVLIDRTYTVLHLSETAGRYLQLPRGTITNNLLKLVRFELQFELRTALFQAFEHQKAVVSAPTAVQFNGTARPVTLFVRPQSGIGVPETAETEENIEQLMLVFFLEDEIEKDNIAKLPVPDPDPNFADGDRRDVLVAQMAGENQRLLEQIQTTSEEYESANEEMKSANEELQSINEEYRSTTEELETSKEELQSMNEELHTVNAELKNKVEEVTQAHSDMENLMAATDIATLFLDRELQIKRYTPATIELFNIRAGDRGRPLSHLTHKLAYEKLADDAKEVLKYLTPIEREVQDLDGHWLLMRQRPYRTADHRIDGVVLTFVDITARKAAEEKLHRQKKELNKINKSLEEKVRQRTNELWLAKTYNDKILSTIREGLLVLKPDLTVEFASESFYQMFVVKEEETIGRLVYELGNGQWDIPALRTLLEEILPKQNAFNDYRVEHEFENLGHRVMLLNARRMDNITRILLAIEDVTKRH
jgi:two-component system CheB/CheR fusion protein